MTTDDKNLPTKKDLGQNFWDAQYRAKSFGWDLGEVSPPLKAYIDQLTDKTIRILIPGCGNTYEADYLLHQGFQDITLIDIAPTLVAQLEKKYLANHEIKVILGDFFEHNGGYDLILEQTFFCALNPDLRSDYTIKMDTLLSQDGKLAGLLFSSEFENEGPPFGGTKAEYEKLFKEHFIVQVLKDCYNSYYKRAGNELFFIFKKKPTM